MNPAIRVVRILQCAIIVSVLLFYYVLHVTHPAPQSVNANFQLAVVCCAIASAMAGFIMQRAIKNAPDRPNASGQKSTPRGRWLSGHVIRFATAESVALFGFVLGMMGSTSNVVIALFAGSLLLLVFWQPGEVPTETESQGPIR
jgi:F0F1-type ATP synthase membrane subunit c/vacuolar-type H+-ATPase subunit K